MWSRSRCDVNVRVTYVDGTTLETGAEHWPELPGEGVDQVTLLTASGSRTAGGCSLYWLYPEAGCWVVGEGCVRYDPKPLTEVVCSPDGSMVERQVGFMPDLRLAQVKLGHWRPGEERPAWH